MQYKDYYDILGVKKDVSQDEIKKAYRRLARKYHPDVSKEADAEARFKEVNEAHEVLKDPEKRAAYDQLGSNWQAGQDFRPPPGWDAGFEFSGGGHSGFSGTDFSDFFESLFGGQGPFAGASPHQQAHRGARRQRGEDHHAKILISVEDSFNGASTTVKLRIPKLNAQGHVQLQPHTLNVKIPKGITSGKKIRLSGQGAPGTHGGPKGDLFLEVEFQAHPLYRAEGQDLYVKLPITPWEAALGAKVEAPTLAGAVTLTIPPGARSGQKLRLPKRGLPGKTAGDQYVELQIATPPAETDADKAFYQTMSQAFDFDPRARLTA